MFAVEFLETPAPSVDSTITLEPRDAATSAAATSATYATATATSAPTFDLGQLVDLEIFAFVSTFSQDSGLGFDQE